MNSIIKIILALATIALLGFIIFKTTNKTHLNTLPINYKGNVIINTTNNTFYDTIALQSLDRLNVKNTTLHITDLSKATVTDQIDNIRGAVGVTPKGDIVMFLSEMSVSNALEIVPHEAVHVKQITSGLLINLSAYEVLYKSKKYDLLTTPYSSRPWEVDAYDEGDKLSSVLKKELIRNK